MSSPAVLRALLRFAPRGARPVLGPSPFAPPSRRAAPDAPRRHAARRSLLALLFLSTAAAPALAQQVTLPLDDFEALRARANPEAEPASPPPAPYALESAELEIVAGVESATVVQTLELVLYAEGTQVVPLGAAGSFTAARLGTLDGAVEAGSEGWSLRVAGRGRHRLRIESVVPLRADAAATRPTSTFALRFPPAAVVRGRLTAPPAVEEAEISGGGLLRRQDDGWALLAGESGSPSQSGGAPSLFTLRGKRTLPERALLPLRYESTAFTAATLSRTRLRVRAWVEARIAQGRLEVLRLVLPAGLEVVRVEGAVAGWRVEAGELTVTPLEPVEDALAVEVELEGRPQPAFTSPLLQPQGSSRTLLLARAALEGDGLLHLGEAGAGRVATAAEVATLPQELRRGAALMAVLDPARAPRWEAEWAEGAELLASQVDRLLVDVAVGEAGQAAYQLWAEVRNRGAQQIVLAMPAGFRLLSCSRDGEAVAAGDGTQGLSLPLAGSEASQVLHVAGLLPLPLPAGGDDLTLPLPALSAPAGRVEVRLLLPGGRLWTLADPSRGAVVRPPPATAEAAGRRQAALASNLIARQLRAAAPIDPAVAGGLLPRPTGFTELTAAWSAVSATPTPLVLDVRSQREASPWF